MKAKDLAEILLQHPDAEVNMPSLSEAVASTPILESDLKLKFGGRVIVINNDRTAEH